MFMFSICFVGDTDSSSRDSVFLRSESSPQSPEKSGKQFESANAEWRKRQSMMLAMHGRESETSLESFDLPSVSWLMCIYFDLVVHLYIYDS